MAVEVSDLIRALKAKLGAEEDVQRRHVFYKLRRGELLLRTTSLSHGLRGTIGQPLLGLIAKQLGLTTRELEELVACTLSAEAYFILIAPASG